MDIRHPPRREILEAPRNCLSRGKGCERGRAAEEAETKMTILLIGILLPLVIIVGVLWIGAVVVLVEEAQQVIDEAGKQ